MRGRALTRMCAGLLAVSLAGVSCGGDDDSGATAQAEAATVTSSPSTGSSASTASTASTQPLPVDPDGVLRIAADFTTVGGLKLDPATILNSVYVGMLYLIYGTPIRPGTEPGTYRPGLAESFEVVNPTTFTMTLRPGLRFHNGAPYDAETVREGILRLKDPKYAGLNQSFLSQISDVQAAGNTVTVSFATPIAGLAPAVFSRHEGMFPPPGYTDIERNPVGAGPYRFVSYDEQRLVLEKWGESWDADDYHLKRIEYVQAAAGQAALNALQAGQVDLITVNPINVEELQSSDRFDVVVNDLDAFYYLAFCADHAPVDSLEVRQAIAAALDRSAINQAVQDGLGKVQVGLWPRGTPYAVDVIEQQVGPDLDNARQLLEESGVADPALTIVVQGNQPLQVQLAEIIQGQLREIGMDVTILPSVNVSLDFITGESPKGQLGTTINTSGGVLKLTSQPGLRRTAGIDNGCQFQDDRLVELAAELTAIAPDDPRAGVLWAEVQQIVYDNAYAVPLMTQSADFAFDKGKVAGIGPGVSTPVVTSVANPFLDGVYIIKK